MLLFEKVFNRLARVSLEGVDPPKCKVRRGETVLGVMDDDLKKLWILLALLHLEHDDDHERMQREAEAAGKMPATDPRLSAQHVRLHAQLELVQSAFSASVIDQYPSIGRDEIGVRKGWKLVTYKSQPPLVLAGGISLMDILFGPIPSQGDS